MTAQRLLILGGTAEAAALARSACARFGDRLQIITSLAGKTRSPAPLPGQTRIGGFGGPAGLAVYLAEHEIDRVIDATHPFATRIASEARIACDQAGVPRLLLLRPPWRRHPRDRWIEVHDMNAAAGVVRRAARRAWLTIGYGELVCFSAVTGVKFLVRLVDPPVRPLPLCSYEVVLGRGPFTLCSERELLARHGVDVLVCKASGGAATEAKLIAARELGVPVIMVRRPAGEPGEAVETVEAALDWLATPYRVPEPRRLP